VDYSRNVTDRGGLFGKSVNGCARGHIGHGGAAVESGIAQDLRRRLGILAADVSEQNVLSRADATCNRKADQAGPYHYGDVGHLSVLRRGAASLVLRVGDLLHPSDRTAVERFLSGERLPAGLGSLRSAPLDLHLFSS